MNHYLNIIMRTTAMVWTHQEVTAHKSIIITTTGL